MTGASRHGHIWLGADGTGLHAPYGELVRDEATGDVCCHLCGRWFTFLGGHVRVHGLDADSYRELAGLGATRALASRDLSERVRTRQRARYAADADARQQLAAGQEMARSGLLAGRERAGWRGERTDEVPLERRRERARQLACGRATSDSRREQAQAERLRKLGYDDLSSYLQRAYAAGGSLESLGRATGLGRVRLRDALVEAGVELRASGVNTDAGKRARADYADARAARRVGVSDLYGWMVARRDEGWTLQQLALVVGHSVPWVRTRLESVGPLLPAEAAATA